MSRAFIGCTGFKGIANDTFSSSSSRCAVAEASTAKGQESECWNTLDPEDPTAAWNYEVVCDFMHLSHNFHPVNWDDDEEEEMIIAGKEGVWHFDRQEAAGMVTPNN